MTTSAIDICFVAMPFTAIERPLISFGLLQSILKKDHISAITVYSNLDFAKKIGVHNYFVMSQFGYLLFGEWVFSESLFPDALDADNYIRNLHDSLQNAKIKPLPQFYDKDYLINLRRRAHDFLMETAHEVITQHNPRIVASSSIFDNHIACISFLKCIKEVSPDTVTMIGGSNCDGEMGKTTHKLFPFVDYVVSGYADSLITELCKKIITYGTEMPESEVPNQVFAPIFREKEYRYAGEHLDPCHQTNLHELPMPDYKDYFDKLNGSEELNNIILPTVPVESSRGCYWGKCKFCGLNSTQLKYEKKGWEQVYREITSMTEQYKTKKVEFVDNAIHFTRLSDMFDALIRNNCNVQMFAEVRVQLKKDRLRKMKEAGLIWMQPGIESLNDNLLDCMSKGSTMLQNIQIMKWAQQFGISIVWSLMHNFPFEKDEWFGELSHVLPLLVHLQPPRGMTQLRFDRFSEYYLNQRQYGLKLKALDSYSHIYPYDQPTLDSLVYFFEDSKKSSVRERGLLRRLFGRQKRNVDTAKKIVDDWMKSFYSQDPFRLIYEEDNNTVSIHDSRPLSFKNNYTLNTLEGEILLFSDEAKSCEELQSAFGTKYEPADIEKAVHSLVNKKIVMQHKNKVLSLAVEAPVPALPGSRDFPLGTVIKDIDSYYVNKQQ